MDEQQALLNAIHANPDDDLVRLVYADWLDEHGRPERAEFIRLQVELARRDWSQADEGLRERVSELLEVHREEWVAEVGIVESKECKVEFRRGFVNGLSLFDETVTELGTLVRIPGVRDISLGRCLLTPEVLQTLSTLDLDSLHIYDTPFPREWLEILEPLPCGTALTIEPREGPFDRDMWHEFQTRRMSTLAELSAIERHTEARRWLRGQDERHYYRHGGKSASVDRLKACDVEMRLLAELPELEEVRIDECDLTTAGLGQIARLPHLKSLRLFWVPTESITPLARCTSLESLSVCPESGVVVGDAGTEGLERLVNLRGLQLQSTVGERTLARLGPLTRLAVLHIELAGVSDPKSFASLARLTALEHLNIDGDIPGSALRHIASCVLLRKATLYVPTGTAEDFVAFESLTELRELHIKGDSVTDEAIRHFAPLKNLRTLLAQDTSVTPAGAQWLADQLPEVTIVLDEHVIKSSRAAIRFRRHETDADELVSAMLPTHWFGHIGRSFADPCHPFVEDGWESIYASTGEAVGPAQIWLYKSNGMDPTTVANSVVQYNATNYPPNIEEHDLAQLTGLGASCIFSNTRVRHLVVVTASEGKSAVLVCEAPHSRFEEFRALFLFAARSLRVGEEARQGVGEEVTVAVSEL